MKILIVEDDRTLNKKADITIMKGTRDGFLFSIVFQNRFLRCLDMHPK